MQVSAFVDGELPENEAELLVRRLSQDALLRNRSPSTLQSAGSCAANSTCRAPTCCVSGLRQSSMRDRSRTLPMNRPWKLVRVTRGHWPGLAYCGRSRSRWSRSSGLQQTVDVEVGGLDDAVSVNEGVATRPSRPCPRTTCNTSDRCISRPRTRLIPVWTAAQLRAEELDGEEDEDASRGSRQPDTESVTSQP